MDKAGDFVVALVIYAMRCIKDGETDTLTAMGFGPSEVADLAALRFGDLQRIERLKTHCLEIKVDRQAFAEMIGRVRSDSLSIEWEHELIRADAPLDMMRRLFGTNSRAYARLRRLYDVSSAGRPREPSEDDAAILWRLWAGRVRDAPHGVLRPFDYLAISRQCSLPLRTVWRVSQRFASSAG